MTPCMLVLTHKTCAVQGKNSLFLCRSFILKQRKNNYEQTCKAFEMRNYIVQGKPTVPLNTEN
jgi:hypothetical protein